MFPGDERAQAWFAAYVGVPFAVLWPMSELLSEEPGMRVLLGGLLGAAIGLGLHALTAQRPHGHMCSYCSPYSWSGWS